MRGLPCCRIVEYVCAIVINHDVFYKTTATYTYTDDNSIVGTEFMPNSCRQMFCFRASYITTEQIHKVACNIEQ